MINQAPGSYPPRLDSLRWFCVGNPCFFFDAETSASGASHVIKWELKTSTFLPVLFPRQVMCVYNIEKIERTQI